MEDQESDYQDFIIKFINKMNQKNLQFSNTTKERAEIAKQYIERKYSKLIQQQKQKKHNWNMLFQKMQQLNLTQTEQQTIKINIVHKETQNLRLKRKKINMHQFQPIKIIGKGAFGQVRLCRDKENKQPVAIKKLKKHQMIFKNKVVQVKAQRDILAISENNPWIVQLKYSFQDPNFLYLVMQYLPGGDLMNLLIKKDILTQAQCRFYAAELVMAIDSIHKLNYIHRDIKPDNIILDSNGHIKLSDFGLCKYTLQKNIINKKSKPLQLINNRNKYPQNYKRARKMVFSAVGTPDYVAPEVQFKSGYTQSVDWWSLGIIIYQMLVGYPPFISQEPSDTWKKILNWKSYLVFPKQIIISNKALDLIRRLINDPKQRLGSNGVEEILNHPFFEEIDWKNLRNTKAPYIPKLQNEFDTSNFDTFEEEQQCHNENEGRVRRDSFFIGYTYKKGSESCQNQILKAYLQLDQKKQQKKEAIETAQTQKSKQKQIKETNNIRIIKKKSQSKEKQKYCLLENSFPVKLVQKERENSHKKNMRKGQDKKKKNNMYYSKEKQSKGNTQYKCFQKQAILKQYCKKK